MADTKCTNTYVHSRHKRKNILRFILDPSATYCYKTFGTIKVLVFSLCVCVCVATSFWSRSVFSEDGAYERNANCRTVVEFLIEKRYLPLPGFPMIFHLSQMYVKYQAAQCRSKSSVGFFLLFSNHKNSAAPIEKGNKP